MIYRRNIEKRFAVLYKYKPIFALTGIINGGMIDTILHVISNLSIPGFFVTAAFTKEAEDFPVGLEPFILEKLERIRQGVKTRKFSYQESGWRIVLTYFPTDQVVDERYAMKNR